MTSPPINLEWSLSPSSELNIPLSGIETEIPSGPDIDSVFTDEQAAPENMYTQGASEDHDDIFNGHCRRFHTETCDGNAHSYLCAAHVRFERSQDGLYCTQGVQCQSTSMDKMLKVSDLPGRENDDPRPVPVPPAQADIPFNTGLGYGSLGFL